MEPMYNVRLGVSPINWINNDMDDLGDQYEIGDVLAAMRALGFAGTEMSRKFPADPLRLRALLASHRLVLAGAWKTVLFSAGRDPEGEFASFQAHARLLKTLGSPYAVVCDGGKSLHWDETGHRKNVEPYTDADWARLAAGLNRAGAYARRIGIKLAYHPHVGTNVEGPEAIDRLLALTDPDDVGIVYDTGHILAGGGDPIEVLRRHAGRVAAVHLKDVRRDVLVRVRERGDVFLDAVRRGIFTTPGSGCIDFPAVVGELRARGYQGWMIIEAEQDPRVAEPVAYAREAKTLVERLMYE